MGTVQFWPDSWRLATMRTLGAAGVLVLAATGPFAASGAAAAPDDVPMLGSTTLVPGISAEKARATVLVHGVRRVPGATVLYFSAGLPEGSQDQGAMSWTELAHVPRDRRYSVAEGSLLGGARLVDMKGKRVYSVLVDEQQRALASPTVAWPGTDGEFFSLYEVLPELPAGLTSVDVLIGNADVIHDVPVADGVLEPAVEQAGPLPLGKGWPKVDLAAAAKSWKPEQSIRELTVKTSDIEETVVNRETPDSVSVDLSADVLFAVDSATLGPAATAKIKVAAEQINSRSAGGQIRVVGHTDSSGSDSYNDDLSKRRAQSVEAVLKPLVTVSGASLVVQGRGEREPVASNESSSGRKENRRVSVVFAAKEGK